MHRLLVLPVAVVGANPPRAGVFTQRSCHSVLQVALLVLTALLAAMAVPSPVLADNNTLPVAAVSTKRLDATVTKTTIVTAFATARDIVEVYNYVPVAASGDWRLATSMDRATWVFKPGGGAPKLAIFFTIEAGKHVARFYDDQLAEGAVPVTINHNHVVLGHPLHWTLQAETTQPWISPDGRPATDLHIQGAFSLPHEDDASSLFAHRWHGQDAWEFRMVDPQGSGVPEYTLLQLYPQVGLTAAVPHTQLDINVAGYPVTAFTGSIFWPYLGDADVGERAWFDHRPPLSMNWTTGQLRDFGSIIPDLEPEDGMQIFSETAIVNDQVNGPDFENPFAYYRFDPGHSGFPNLIIRHFYFPPGDEFLQAGGAPQPAEFVRYSWGNGDGLMQYKLGLLGRHSLTTILPLSGFSVQTIGYASLPSWVVSRQWDFETFVASETGGYRSSEGIYDWDYVSGDFSWAFGDSSSLPLDAYRTITPGFRGEYRVLPAAAPHLYIDPADGRLHLLGAERGVWTIDQHQTIDTRSLDGQTVGQWTRNVDSAPQETIYALPQAYLYAANDEIVVQPHPTVAPVVPLAPPKDANSLQALRRLLPSNPPSLAVGGLRTMLDQTGHGEVTLTGATLTHVRLTADGWRADIRTGPDVAVLPGADAPPTLLQTVESALGCVPDATVGPPLLQCVQAPALGRYVLQYDGAWHLQAATPPDVRVLSVQARTGTPGLAEMPITITLSNGGETDSSGQALHIWAQRPGYPRVEIGQLKLDVPAGEQRQFSFSWLPSGPGNWSIEAALLPPPGAPAQEAGSSVQPPTITVINVPADHRPAWWMLGPVPSPRLIGGAMAVLASLGVVMAVSVWTVLR